MHGSFQLMYTFDFDSWCTGAINLCAHPVEHLRQVDHFRLASRILKNGLPVCERGGHHQILRPGNGDLVQYNFGSGKTLGRRLDVTMLRPYRRAELFEALDVQVNGPGTDGTSAGQRHSRVAGARQERAKDENRGAHRFDQIVRCFVGKDLLGAKARGVVGLEFDYNAKLAQQPARGEDVVYQRDVFKRDLAGSQQRGGHRRQR